MAQLTKFCTLFTINIFLMEIITGLNLLCNFDHFAWEGFGTLYTCDVSNAIKSSSEVVKSVSDEDILCERISCISSSRLAEKDVYALRVKDVEWNFIPRNISIFFPNLKVLQIIVASLKNITKPEFEGLENLRELNLWNNSLQEFGVDTFDDLKLLKILYLSKNMLKFIYENSFANLHNLKVVHLYDNQIKFLADNLFENNLKLEVLLLQNNDFTPLSLKIFGGCINFDSKKNPCLGFKSKKKEKLLTRENESKKLGKDLKKSKTISDCTIYKVLFGCWKF